jgi:hypothetical protein
MPNATQGNVTLEVHIGLKDEEAFALKIVCGEEIK